MRSVADYFPRRGEATGRDFARFSRAAAFTLVAALPIAVLPWGIDPFSYVKGLLTYGFTLAAVLGWTAAYITTGEPRWHGTSSELALWAYLLTVMVSSATSVDPRLSFLGAPLRHEGMLIVICYLALYFIGVHLFGSHRGLRSILLPAAVAAVLTVGYGLLQSFVPPLIAGEAFTREKYGGLGIQRISSTVGGPVVFGGYLALMLPVLFALAATDRSRIRVVWLVTGCVALIDLALTLTRAAWLAAAVGMVIFAVFGALDSSRRREIALAVLAGGVIAAAILVRVVGSPSEIGSRVTSAFAADSGSSAQHLYIWGRTLTLIRARPLFGWGLETLGEVFPYDRSSLVKYFGLQPVIMDRAHNDLLQVAVSVGVPGAVAYVVFWLLVVKDATALVRRTRGSERVLAAGVLAGLAAYLVQAQFSFSAVAVTPVVWLLAGAAAGWKAKMRTDRNGDGANNLRLGQET